MDRSSLFICVSTHKHLCCVWKSCVSRSTSISFQVLSKSDTGVQVQKTDSSLPCSPIILLPTNDGSNLWIDHPFSFVFQHANICAVFGSLVFQEAPVYLSSFNQDSLICYMFCHSPILTFFSVLKHVIIHICRLQRPVQSNRISTLTSLSFVRSFFTTNRTVARWEHYCLYIHCLAD